ncbi:hypothetical protein BN946_scf184982.g12 [Trametes cinnabarina]|uniref:Uncharacterized protein n=1 Tax=Pycnoporus cinnabarinus TaxID=5643 RepID=A0A060SVN6_PYCCI|nr:hypothetical protein BN946_scf184982.g12 [Trametes cinnabarina]
MKAEESSVQPRSPLTASSNSARFASAHFHALLQGSESPAKKLDFGAESHADDSSASGENGSPRTFRRSPKKTPASRPRRSPRLSARCPASQISTNPSAISHEPILIPRDVTPSDPQSIHYPGFNIYQDPFTVLPTSSSQPTSHYDHAPEASSDKELNKENRPPRRKLLKKTADPMTPEVPLIKAALLSASSTRVRLEDAKLVPVSPHTKHVCDYLSASHTTPKERAARSGANISSSLIVITPGKTPLGTEQRKLMRQAMEEEADES